ncbi:SDR family NAD(P)-dependent oxidoreductase [Glaciecola siphonariae]|uniref:SDR family NAD(P)-dependent oxidoreductase n=1 Tax=Glaciecola siphonariae TaxID=521012 RepID=A0ABV9M0A1_9ALTE
MRHLRNKVFVVTGAGSGIGRALSIALDKEGAQLALNDINEQALQETAKLLKNKAITRAFSVAQRDEWLAFKTEVMAHFGGLDALINNAGIAHEAVAVEHLRETDLKKVMDINFYGVVHGTQVFLPELARAREAAVVNISSIFGVTAVGLQSAYCASKFAVRGYTESLRMEAMSYYPNLLVSVVHPGGIDTNVAENAITAGSRTEEERHKDLSTFKQTFITSPEKAAATIIEGIKNSKTRILIGMDAKIMDLTARLMPVGYSKRILKEMKKNGLVDGQIIEPIEKREGKQL